MKGAFFSHARATHAHFLTGLTLEDPEEITVAKTMPWPGTISKSAGVHRLGPGVSTAGLRPATREGSVQKPSEALQRVPKPFCACPILAALATPRRAAWQTP